MQDEQYLKVYKIKEVLLRPRFCQMDTVDDGTCIQNTPLSTTSGNASFSKIFLKPKERLR
jgi:hypothetical protein